MFVKSVRWRFLSSDVFPYRREIHQRQIPSRLRTLTRGADDCDGTWISFGQRIARVKLPKGRPGLPCYGVGPVCRGYVPQPWAILARQVHESAFPVS